MTVKQTLSVPVVSQDFSVVLGAAPKARRKCYKINLKSCNEQKKFSEHWGKGQEVELTNDLKKEFRSGRLSNPGFRCTLIDPGIKPLDGGDRIRWRLVIALSLWQQIIHIASLVKKNVWILKYSKASFPDLVILLSPQDGVTGQSTRITIVETI